jgi:MauM/NapG family ferredoxin protein
MVAFRRTVQFLSLLLFCYLVITTRARIEGEFYRVQSPISPYIYFTTNPLTYVSASAASSAIPAVSWIPLVLLVGAVLAVGWFLRPRIPRPGLVAVGAIAVVFALNFVVFFDPIAEGRGIAPVDYIPLLVMVGLVLVLGRFFCGWVCPLGAMIDGAAYVWKPPKKPQPSRWVPGFGLKYYILLLILIMALFGANIVGFFDPITIAMRGLSLAVSPFFEWISRNVIGELWDIPVVNKVSEPVYGVLKEHYLSILQPEFQYAAVYLGVLLAIFGLSKIRRRYWCRYLCPLGATHALLGRFSLWRRRVSPACNDCTLCAKRCRTAAIDAEDFTVYDPRECIYCMDCRKICPTEAVEFTFVPSSQEVRDVSAPIQVSRRGLLAAVGASLIALPVFRATAHSRSDQMTLLRPPGAVGPEEEFLKRCIRCGECMRVCPNHALQPALLQFGLEPMWTPVLTPRIGYCEYLCTLCTEVCPTGALEPLSQASKKAVRSGTAFFDKNRCIPWAENDNCLVCEEVCPVSPKSIQMRDEEVLDDEGNARIIKRPFIVEANCVGCGICENKCPVEGTSAVRVAPRYESRYGGYQPPTTVMTTDDPYGAGSPYGGTGAGDEASTPTKGSDPYGSDPYS